MSQQRGHWGSKAGFILAAAGSAVGLGNIWKFPYITGENGGGAFVAVYLGCIALIALPILIGEIIMGKRTQQSAVPAFRELSKPASPWMGIGWMGVLAAFLLLSYYAVIAGWTMHYVWLAVQGSFSGQDAEGIQAVFGEAASSPSINLTWMFAFMALTTVIVAGGIKGGIELASRIMLPILGLILLALMIVAATSAKGGFSQAADFVFSFRTDQLTADGVLEAVGHAFFSVGVGMGTMIAYGSYLK
ncbi:MAG: sodium-dependent transporter, partial [Phycisphaerales bacterium]|nr:sodium-dependent transporter [Phycisphaerales bacterium]